MAAKEAGDGLGQLVFHLAALQILRPADKDYAAQHVPL